jgi:hypothetical protein
VRAQHYRFCHQVLTDAVLQSPDRWWAAAAAQGVAMVHQAWATAGQGLGPDDLVDGSALQIGPLMHVPGVEAVVITPPPPQAPAECYFIALVRVPGGSPRYFVAERGVDADGGVPRAFWAEWRYAPGGGIMRIRGQDLPQISPEALVAAAAEECRGAPAAPFVPSPGGAPAPAKKNRAGLFVGCGCLSLVGLVVLVGGWLFYQEEIRGFDIPTSEVESVSVEPGKPFILRFKWEGTGYAFNNVFLAVEDGKKRGGDFKVKGTLHCSRSGSPRTFEAALSGRKVHRLESKGGDAFSAWLFIGDEYSRSSSATIECTGTVQPVSGQWTKARAVVTQRQRPSDFFAR